MLNKNWLIEELIDRRDACPTGRLGDVFALLAFVFFSCNCSPRLYATRCTLYAN